MCGILSLFLATKIYSTQEIMKAFMTLVPRGPDNYDYYQFDDKIWFGFHRLKINDLIGGDQPFYIDGIFLICNGEIYNHQHLQTLCGPSTSNSDCEVIIRCYKKFGIEKTVQLLDGVFAFVLFDTKHRQLYIVRDRIGVRPLFYSQDNLGNFGIASEAKALESLNLPNIRQFPAATIMNINHQHIKKMIKYWTIPQLPHYNTPSTLRQLLTEAVHKRLMSDRPIGCLLSGGLDSSVIAYLLSQETTELNTFSIGFKESTDLQFARKVAQHLNTRHHEIVITHEEGLEAIAEVIYAIESYDITTVRASIGMYLLCKYIKENFAETVIYSGEGADELLCGYLYFHSGPNADSVYDESRRLVTDLPYYDVLRADRCTAANGLELRVPFLDQKLVEYCMSLPGEVRRPRNNIEKYYLRKAFEDDLPKEVVWRRKEGMSDGVGGLEKPWYSFIQDLAEKCITDEQLAEYKLLKPYTKEAVYYYQIFKEKFTHVPIKYHWMPKWSQTDDPSGRVLEIFNN